MTISVRRLTDVLATTASGRLYRIEVFTQPDRQDGPATGDMTFRYILRTSEGERVIALDERRYRLHSGEVLTALPPAPRRPPALDPP
ncbi:6-phosphofructokinase [Achromobacter xylosoxidans]|uniref:6-phosphofructokinase n=1 Tax=Alcaligenes xylosoxydans xylosoxydans TaxID=85698 RepID=UPI0022B88697|nr:6-phosphofructokinase [Achromobacter xylosoxidans]MCZ8391151.1 6-phosphofructokinase [Achromobacter xylosoxidans]